jgi:hypothetical protein
MTTKSSDRAVVKDVVSGIQWLRGKLLRNFPL